MKAFFAALVLVLAASPHASAQPQPSPGFSPYIMQAREVLAQYQAVTAQCMQNGARYFYPCMGTTGAQIDSAFSQSYLMISNFSGAMTSDDVLWQQEFLSQADGTLLALDRSLEAVGLAAIQIRQPQPPVQAAQPYPYQGQPYPGQVYTYPYGGTIVIIQPGYVVTTTTTTVDEEDYYEDVQVHHHAHPHPKPTSSCGRR